MTKKEIAVRLKDNAMLLEMRATDIRNHIEKGEYVDAEAWLTRTRSQVIGEMIGDIYLFMSKKLSDK